MPQITFTVDASRLTATLEKITPNVHDALVAVMKPTADVLAAEARSAAAAHIRFLGKKPGQYLASIYGGAFDRGNRVGGYVRSGDPLARRLEFGVALPARNIFPKAAEVLHFDGSAGEVFAKVVHFPGATVPPYPAIEPTFAAAEGRLRAIIEDAARSGAAR